MENVKSSLALNLSNQTNTYKSRKSNLSQFNFFIILGLEYLENRKETEGVPVSVNINKSGELTINGLNEQLLNDGNICIYSDKKVTNSDE